MLIFHSGCSLLRLNASGRASDGDYVSILHIDEPGDDGLFGLSQLKPIRGKPVTVKEILGLHGFDAETINNSKLKLWLINHRAPVDVDNKLLDATKLGANSTVEEFEVIRGSNEMRHIKTIANDEIVTPNKLAATGDGGFLVTNDHSGKGEYMLLDFCLNLQLTTHLRKSWFCMSLRKLRSSPKAYNFTSDDSWIRLSAVATLYIAGPPNVTLQHPVSINQMA